MITSTPQSVIDIPPESKAGGITSLRYSGFPVTRNNILRVNVYTRFATLGTPLKFVISGLLYSSRDNTLINISETLLIDTPSNAYQTNSLSIPMVDGYLINLTMTNSSNATVERGQMFARALIYEGTVSTSNFRATLCSGYVSWSSPLHWDINNFLIQDSLDGNGHNTSLLITAPGAGSNFSYTIPGNTAYKIKSLTFYFVTSATVATRTAALYIDQGSFSDMIHRAGVGNSQMASLNYSYNFGVYLNTMTGFGNSSINTALPDIMLREGTRLLSSIYNIQAGDVISNIYLNVEEFILFPEFI